MLKPQLGLAHYRAPELFQVVFWQLWILPSLNLNLGNLIFPEFTGLNEEVVIKILEQLQKDEKAELIQMDDGFGVKFF